MSKFVNEMHRTLCQIEFGQPTDPTNGYSEDGQRINFLSEIVDGSQHPNFVIRMFKRYQPRTFDIESWIEQKIASGEIIPRDEWPEEEEAQSDLNDYNTN